MPEIIDIGRSRREEAAQPSGDGNEFAAISINEKLNKIVVTLRTAQLQSGEARVQGVFLAIGALADLVRDESLTMLRIAQVYNAMAEMVEVHDRKLDNVLQRLAKVERSLRM